MPFTGSELQEIPHFGSGVPPLFPVTHPDPAANPLVYTRNWPVVLGNAKVIYPASDIAPCADLFVLKPKLDSEK